VTVGVTTGVCVEAGTVTVGKMRGVDVNMAGAVVVTAGEASTGTSVGVLSANIPAFKLHDARASIRVQAVISHLHTLAVYHKNLPRV
jgi:hypothetical protein